jgi:hypothetical protein
VVPLLLAVVRLVLPLLLAVVRLVLPLLLAVVRLVLPLHFASPIPHQLRLVQRLHLLIRQPHVFFDPLKMQSNFLLLVTVEAAPLVDLVEAELAVHLDLPLAQ